MCFLGNVSKLQAELSSLAAKFKEASPLNTLESEPSEASELSEASEPSESSDNYEGDDDIVQPKLIFYRGERCVEGRIN